MDFPGVSVSKESSCNAGDPALIPGSGRSTGEGMGNPLQYLFLGFPCGSVGRESACSTGGLGLIPGLGRSSGEAKRYPLQYSGLENSTDCPWGHKELDTTESDFHFHFFPPGHSHPLHPNLRRVCWEIVSPNVSDKSRWHKTQ